MPETKGNEGRALAFDRMAFEHRQVVTQVAHNDGPGSASLGEPAGVYNALVIGATGPREATPDADPSADWRRAVTLPATARAVQPLMVAVSRIWSARLGTDAFGLAVELA